MFSLMNSISWRVCSFPLFLLLVSLFYKFRPLFRCSILTAFVHLMFFFSSFSHKRLLTLCPGVVNMCLSVSKWLLFICILNLTD